MSREAVDAGGPGEEEEAYVGGWWFWLGSFVPFGMLAYAVVAQ